MTVIKVELAAAVMMPEALSVAPMLALAPIDASLAMLTTPAALTVATAVLAEINDSPAAARGCLVPLL